MFRYQHTPVMLEEVLQYLGPQDGRVYVDCTFGLGGHSEALLNRAKCTVIGVDQDPEVKKYAGELERKYPGRFSFVEGNFGDIELLLKNYGVEKVDGVLMDLGISSMQVDDYSRGFSFDSDSKLDMRMGTQGFSAWDFVNSAGREELARVIYNYGDERRSRGIAEAIIEQRKISPINTCRELSRTIVSIKGFARGKIHPATKTFQAIRMHVNSEVEALEHCLISLPGLLNIGGGLVVISFHSGEDRIIKSYLKRLSAPKVSVSKYSKAPREVGLYEVLTKRVVTPSAAELQSNCRARSAKLRAARRS